MVEPFTDAAFFLTCALQVPGGDTNLGCHEEGVEETSIVVVTGLSPSYGGILRRFSGGKDGGLLYAVILKPRDVLHSSMSTPSSTMLPAVLLRTISAGPEGRGSQANYLSGLRTNCFGLMTMRGIQMQV